MTPCVPIPTPEPKMDPTTETLAAECWAALEMDPDPNEPGLVDSIKDIVREWRARGEFIEYLRRRLWNDALHTVEGTDDMLVDIVRENDQAVSTLRGGLRGIFDEAHLLTDEELIGEVRERLEVADLAELRAPPEPPPVEGPYSARDRAIAAPLLDRLEEFVEGYKIESGTAICKALRALIGIEGTTHA